jgi:hypothetical protein
MMCDTQLDDGPRLSRLTCYWAIIDGRSKTYVEGTYGFVTTSADIHPFV